MSTTSSQNRSNGVVRQDNGSYLTTDTAAPVVIDLGYAPSYFRWLNETDRIQYEWFKGMAADTTLKTVAAGTRTLDTADAAINVSGNKVTIAAAAAIQNKQCRWKAD
jgi:hypothetical protein